MKTLLISASFVLIGLLPGCRPSGSLENDEKSLKVGVLAPLSGVMSGHGSSIEKGAVVAADTINSTGGILGRPIHIVVRDTQSNPAVAVEKAKELILSEGVDVLIGTGFSSESLAVIPTATGNKVPFLYSLDGECKTSMPGNSAIVNPYAYGSGFTERMAVRPFLEHLLRNKGEGKRTKIYFLGGDYVYPKSTNGYARRVAEELGAEVLAEEYLDTNTKDYTAAIQRIIASKADLLVVTNPGESGVIFMKQAQLMELPKKMMVTGFATFDQEAVSAMGSNSEGVICVNRYSMKLKNPQNESFLKSYKKRFGKDEFLPGPTAAAGAYGVLMLLKQGFEKAGKIDADELHKATRDLEVLLPQGVVKVNAINSIFDQHLYIMKIEGQQYHVIEDLGLQSHPLFEGTSVK